MSETEDLPEEEHREAMRFVAKELLKVLIFDRSIVNDVDAMREKNDQADMDSLNEIKKQREAEPYDMRLLGNLGRLFIAEVVDPIIAVSWEVAEDTSGGTVEDRMYSTYLTHVDSYATVLVCEQDPTPYNQLGLRHMRCIYPYDVVARMERVDRSLFPLTGVKVLDLAFANDAYRRHTMKAWECMYSNDPASLESFVTECEQCVWREEWRDLGTKMTRAVRAKLRSNDIQNEKVYCDDPEWMR